MDIIPASFEGKKHGKKHFRQKKSKKKQNNLW